MAAICPMYHPSSLMAKDLHLFSTSATHPRGFPQDLVSIQKGSADILSPGIQRSAHQSHSISSTTSDFSLSGTLSLLMTALSLLLYFSLFGLNAMLHYFKYLLPISSIFFFWSFILSTWENPAWAQSNSSAFLKEPTLLSALRNISNKLVSYASLKVWFSDSTDFSKECWWSRFIPKYL